MQEWLARLRHDLVRPLVWRARDVREDETITDPDERRRVLAAVLDELYDGEGRPIAADALWQQMLAAAPGSVAAGARAGFTAALARVMEVVPAMALPIEDALAAIAALDAAWSQLGGAR